MADGSERTSIPDHPGVKVPPPLIYVGVFALGLLLERFFPILDLPQTSRHVAAVLCIVFWAILTVWSIGLFRRAGTNFIPIKPTTALVFSGPYRFTRNPMYLGFIGLYVGLAMWFSVVWALLLLPGVIAGIQYYVIVREEQYLERKFGEKYLRYKARVRRWL
jgi:protein-S-isoprenylcysteine O-methyltransferase Ste14